MPGALFGEMASFLQIPHAALTKQPDLNSACHTGRFDVF